MRNNPPVNDVEYVLQDALQTAAATMGNIAGSSRNRTSPRGNMCARP
jgi:hypothetical protein